MSDNIIPFRRKAQVPPPKGPQKGPEGLEPFRVPSPTESLAAAMARLPDEAPVLIQFVVKEPPTP